MSSEGARAPLLALVTAAVVISASVASASGTPRIRLKGHARVEAHVTREAGKASLSGTVVDDAGRPVAGARIGVTLARVTEARAPAGHDIHRIPLGTTFPEPCDPAGPEPEIQGDDLVSVGTDDAAHFCVAFDLATDRYVARVESRPTALVDGAAIDVAFDLALPPITLRFAPERATLSLDEERTSISVVASADPSASPSLALDLPLTLSNESGAALGTATTGASGIARFEIDGARLGPPGSGELRVTFAGNARAGGASESVRVERRALVVVDAPEAVSRRLPPAAPEDGIPIQVTAALACARRGCAGSAGGVIEASVAAEGVVGAAPLAGGLAHLVVNFAAPSSDAPGDPNGPGGTASVPISLRYIPDAPWLTASGGLILVQPVRAPSLWRKAPLILAAIAVVAWLVLARAPAVPRKRPTRLPAPLPVTSGGIALVRGDSRTRGWIGQVTDAHDGHPLPGARVAIERREFERIHVVTETTADTNGAFAIAPLDVQVGDELAADAPRHAKVLRPMPAPGTLAVTLVLRKRALLDRLVAWARRQGPPYATPSEPTPAAVRRAAGADGAVARWATAVERAAYADDVVDERAEMDVDRLGPPGAR